MSFRVDLWNGVNIIKNQFSSTLDKISNLYNLLLSYANYQKAFSKNLESLYKENKDKFKEDYSLDQTLSILIDNFKLESECHKKSYKFIKEELIISLKENADKEKSVFNNILNEGIQIQDNFIKIKNNIIIKQKNYNNALKDFYDFINSFDENELKIILDSENDNKPHQSVKDLTTYKLLSDPNIQYLNEKDVKINKQQVAKKIKLIDKINETKKEYKSSLKESNDLLYLYKDKYENFLQSLEEKYKILLTNIQLTLTSSVGHKINLNNELNLLYNSYMENNINNININNEIIEFIVKNATKEFPLNKFEFFTNKFDNKIIDLNKYFNEESEYDINLELDPRRIKTQNKNDVNVFRRRSYIKKNTGDKNKNVNLLESKTMKSDLKDYKIKTNIYLIEDFIEELIIDKDKNKDEYDNNEILDINSIKPLIDKKNEDHLKYLEIIFKFLNKKRAKGNFIINKNSYNIFIDIFNFILNNYPTLDFILKNIIILSQTFYLIENDKSKLNFSKEKNKIFIQNGLKNNPIFNNPETWHRVINFTLSTHISNKDISQVVDKNEINNKLNTLAYNTLASYLCDIKYFTDNKNVFEQVKYFYVKAYNLNEEEINKEVNNNKF